MSSPAADLVIRNASELCTMRPVEGRGEAVLGSISGGSLACRSGQVTWVGPDAELARNVALGATTRVVDAAGCTVTPGLVDCHTHVVFAGDRADEFSLRCEGATYLEIARRGGGIGSTVRATREVGEDRLVELALPRLARLLEFGITTAEAKSGYALNLPDELKMLRAVARLPTLQPIELVPTLLCAHAVPPEHAQTREAYVDLCVKEIVPEVARLGLARFCEAFVEQSAFTVEEGRRILGRGKELGLVPRLHADQMSAMGASELAAELGAATADHLECITDAGIAALAKAKVSAVLVPTSTLFLKQATYAPGRRLWDAGLNVALATNLNPGSAMTENANLSLALACLFNGLTPAEALWAFTRGGARALGLDARLGSIEPGRQADLVVHACPSHRHLAYHFAVSHVRTVIKRGAVVLDRPAAPCAAA
ncbi:MAG: imidazolonepropionase [Deltaproteobacteria bacterium]|nr:imidazolonepropionase [Deltaproteobacteria bacterium]